MALGTVQIQPQIVGSRHSNSLNTMQLYQQEPLPNTRDTTLLQPQQLRNAELQDLEPKNYNCLKPIKNSIFFTYIYKKKS